RGRPQRRLLPGGVRPTRTHVPEGRWGRVQRDGRRVHLQRDAERELRDEFEAVRGRRRLHQGRDDLPVPPEVPGLHRAECGTGSSRLGHRVGDPELTITDRGGTQYLYQVTEAWTESAVTWN